MTEAVREQKSSNLLKEPVPENVDYIDIAHQESAAIAHDLLAVPTRGESEAQALKNGKARIQRGRQQIKELLVEHAQQMMV